MAAIAKSIPLSKVGCFGGEVKEYLWSWQGQQLRVVYETLGKGKPVLLLPAFSTVSTRGEMGSLAKLLSSEFQAVAVDWLGFGQSSRLPLDYRPQLYHQFLDDFVKNVFNTQIAVVAAGHAAGYVMQLAATKAAFSQIVLLAPTWRGPLTVMGANRQIAKTVRLAVRSPIFGQVLYKLNTTPSFLRLMYQRHVYTDASKLTPDFIQHKWQITQQSGARFAPAAFVTGNLDPVQNQADFHAWFQPPPAPVLVVIGEQSPPKSLVEMEALALPGVQMRSLPGSLGLHEEYSAELAEVILPFLLEH